MRVEVKPELLRWACERAGFATDEMDGVTWQKNSNNRSDSTGNSYISRAEGHARFRSCHALWSDHIQSQQGGGPQPRSFPAGLYAIHSGVRGWLFDIPKWNIKTGTRWTS